MTIQKEHYLEYLWYLILSNAYLHDITQLKETIKALDVLPLLTIEVMEKIENILQNKPTQALF